MKIAIDTLFEDPDSPTGAIDYLRNVARVFPRVGPQHDFYLLASKKNLRHFREFEQPNLHVIKCVCSNENMPLRILVQQSQIPVLLKKNKINLLFAPGNVCPLWGKFCRVLKINTLHHYHMPEVVGRTRAAFREVFFKNSAKRADHILANTDKTKTDICNFIEIPEERITVIAEALYDIYGPLSSTQTLAIRSKYGLEQDYILFVSVLYPYKNVETLIKAFAHMVRQNGSQLKLAIVGRDCDAQQSKLQLLAIELGVLDRMQFLGFVPTEDLPAIYSSAQVFVFPSLVETFGKPLVEAMQCGTPVVASKASCIPEVLGGAGLLVNPLDPIEMASAITDVVENRALRCSLVERGLKRGQDFSWEVGARETLEVIERTFRNWEVSQLGKNGSDKPKKLRDPKRIGT